MVLASWKVGPRPSSCQTRDEAVGRLCLLCYSASSAAVYDHLRCCSLLPPVAACQLLHLGLAPATKQSVLSWPQRESEVRVRQPRDKNILNTACLFQFQYPRYTEEI